MSDKTDVQQEHRRHDTPISSDTTSSENDLLSTRQLSSAVQRAHTHPHTLSHRDTLHLQSHLGNKATTQLMRASRPHPATNAGTAMGGLAPGVGEAEEETSAVVGGVTSDRIMRDPPASSSSSTPAPAPAATPPTPAPPTPVTVSSTTNSGPTWGNHGHFDWRVGFTTSGRSGWLVQEIINTYSGTDSSGTAINTSSVVPHYWEAWAVDSTGKVTPAVGANNDYWIRPGRGTGSKGNWSMKGNVHFTTTDPATQGFTPGGVSNAGILLSTTTAPTGLGSVLLARQANGVWDSTGATPTHTGTATP